MSTVRHSRKSNSNILLWTNRFRNKYANDLSSPHITHRAFSISAILASLVRHGVEVNKVVMRPNSQEITICATERERVGGGLGHSVHFSHNDIMSIDATHLQRNALLTAAHSRQCGSPQGLWSLHPEHTTWGQKTSDNIIFPNYNLSTWASWC